jgi:hypothetical protein
MRDERNVLTEFQSCLGDRADRAEGEHRARAEDRRRSFGKLQETLHRDRALLIGHEGVTDTAFLQCQAALG